MFEAPHAAERHDHAGLVIVMAMLAVGSYLLTVDAALATDPAIVVPAQGPIVDVFQALVRRADAGSADAARQALDMVRHGPAVYGVQFKVSERQLRQWRARLACQQPPCIAAS